MRKLTFSLLTILAMSNISMATNSTVLAKNSVVMIPVVTDSHTYVDMGLSVVSTREAHLDFFETTIEQDRTGDISLIAGYEFNPYISVEGRYMISIVHEDILERSSWGIYAKPHYPVLESLKVYGLLGYGGFKADDIDGENINIDDTGFQWGVGTNYEMKENIFIFVDYLTIAKNAEVDRFILEKGKVHSDVITVGAIYTF